MGRKIVLRDLIGKAGWTGRKAWCDLHYNSFKCKSQCDMDMKELA